MHATHLFQSAGIAPSFMNESGYQSTSERASLSAPTLNKSHANISLGRGRAATFTPREDTRLRLTEGRLWITFEAPPSGLAPRNGDHFVAAGECFDLLAGETAVLEPIGTEPLALFDLEPALTLPWRAVHQQMRAHLRRALARAAGAAS